MRTIVIFYQQQNGDWRWTVMDNNRLVIGASTEGYKNFDDAHQNFLRISSLSTDGYKLDVCTGYEAEQVHLQTLEKEGFLDPVDSKESDPDPRPIARPSDPSDL